MASRAGFTPRLAKQLAEKVSGDWSQELGFGVIRRPPLGVHSSSREKGTGEAPSTRTRRDPVPPELSSSVRQAAGIAAGHPSFCHSTQYLLWLGTLPLLKAHSCTAARGAAQTELSTEDVLPRGTTTSPGELPRS